MQFTHFYSASIILSGPKYLFRKLSFFIPGLNKIQLDPSIIKNNERWKSCLLGSDLLDEEIECKHFIRFDCPRCRFGHIAYFHTLYQLHVLYSPGAPRFTPYACDHVSYAESRNYFDEAVHTEAEEREACIFLTEKDSNQSFGKVVDYDKNRQLRAIRYSRFSLSFIPCISSGVCSYVLTPFSTTKAPSPWPSFTMSGAIIVSGSKKIVWNDLISLNPDDINSPIIS